MAAKIIEPFIYPIDPSLHLICGVDEAGRGPLVGNVVAACVILDPQKKIEGLADSKKLSEKKRDLLAHEIKEKALAYGIGECTPAEIDIMNILYASLEAMRRAYLNMNKACELMLIDGNKLIPNFHIAMQAVVKGDARVAEISAASILAKTTRDAELYSLDKKYPEYGFARHKGYPTPFHLEILESLPLLDCYRMSYGPIRKLLEAGKKVCKS